MAAELIAHSDVGFPISGGASKHGTGLVWGVYQIISTEDDDWAVFTDFNEILFADCNKISATGSVIAEPCTVDTSSTNKIVFTSGSTNTIRVMIVGTRGN